MASAFGSGAVPTISGCRESIADWYRFAINSTDASEYLARRLAGFFVTRCGAGPEPTPTQHDPGCPRSPRTVRLISRERRPSLQLWDIGSLSEALQEFRMLSDELVGGLKERRLRADRGFSPFQIVDELPHRILFLRRQQPNNFGKALGCHCVSPI